MDKGSSALTYGGAGAAVGSAFGPVGTVVGGVAGGIYGYLSGDDREDAAIASDPNAYLYGPGGHHNAMDDLPQEQIDASNAANEDLARASTRTAHARGSRLSLPSSTTSFARRPVASR